MKMKAGDSFGETALVNDKPLQESVICSTDCHIAILRKEKYEQILKKIEMKTRAGWISFFKSHPIFGDLTLVSLEKLFYLVELKFYTRNQSIFKEGDQVKGFYLIYRGEASLTKKVTKKVQKKINIGEYYKSSTNMIENKESDKFQSFLRSTINDANKVQTLSKDHELRIMGDGQLLGLEDGLLKRSKNTSNYFSQS